MRCSPLDGRSANPLAIRAVVEPLAFTASLIGSQAYVTRGHSDLDLIASPHCGSVAVSPDDAHVSSALGEVGFRHVACEVPLSRCSLLCVTLLSDNALGSCCCRGRNLTSDSARWRNLGPAPEHEVSWQAARTGSKKGEEERGEGGHRWRCRGSCTCDPALGDLHAGPGTERRCEEGHRANSR